MNILINSGRTVPFLTTRRKLITSIIAKGHNVILTGYQGGYEKEIEEMGASFIKVPLNRAGFNPIKDIALLNKYYNIIKKNKIDIVHSYTIKPNTFGSIAASMAGIKEIFPTINGLGYVYTDSDAKIKIIRMITSILYKIAFKFSKKVFFQNRDDANEMIMKKLIKEEKCIVIDGSGIDLDEFSQIKQPNSFSFIMVTRLLKSKGVYEYLEAARIVKQKYKNIEIKLVGPIDPNPNGIKEEELKIFIDEGIINYLGVSSNVHKLLGDSSVFVLPSYYREGVPHSILEAMATGRAVLTTDVPGCRETVLNEENGFLVRPNCVEDLAEKMIWMIKNPEKVKEMGNQSLLIAKKRFEVNKVNLIIMNAMHL